ncbi:metabotropic glutamate receptor 1-like protein [Dinothrombium tinctorium]
MTPAESGFRLACLLLSPNLHSAYKCVFEAQFCLKAFLIYFLMCNCAVISNSTTTRHTVAAIPGSLVLGALFPVHHTPGPRQAQLRICGDIREQYGIHRVEAAFLAIDHINKDNSILPNITLGIEIRDSCWYSPIALEQSIEFIRDAMAASEESNDFKSELDARKGLQTLPAAATISHSPLFPLLKTPFNLGSHFNTSAICPRTSKKVKNIVGVIGPASSTVTIQ